MFHTNKVDFHQAHKKKKTVTHTNMVCSQMQYIKPSTQIRTYNAGNVFKLVNSSEKEFVEIQKQTTLEKAVEPPERTTMVSKLSEACGLIKLAIMSTQISTSSKQQLDEKY
jgi:non-homologous end joining protein Ku